MSDLQAKPQDGESTLIQSTPKTTDEPVVLTQVNIVPRENQISIENFDENNHTEPIINSPRSLQACQELGIKPLQLVKHTRTEIKNTFRNRVQMTEEAVDLFMQHFEERRKQKIQAVKEVRSKIIDLNVNEAQFTLQDSGRAFTDLGTRPSSQKALKRSRTQYKVRQNNQYVTTSPPKYNAAMAMTTTSVPTGIDASSSKLTVSKSLFGGNSHMSGVNTSVQVEKVKRQENREIELMIQKELETQQRLEKERQIKEMTQRNLQMIQQYRDQKREQKYQKYNGKAEFIDQVRQRQEKEFQNFVERYNKQQAEKDKQEQERINAQQKLLNETKRDRSLKQQKTLELSNKLLEEHIQHHEQKVQKIQQQTVQFEQIRQNWMQQRIQSAVQKQKKLEEAYERAMLETQTKEQLTKEDHEKRSQKANQQLGNIMQQKNNYLQMRVLTKKQREEACRDKFTRTLQDWSSYIRSNLDGKFAKSTRHLTEVEQTREHYFTRHRQTNVLKKISSEESLAQQLYQLECIQRRIEDRLRDDDQRLNQREEEKKMAQYERDMKQRQILFEKQQIKQQLQYAFQKNRFPDIKRLQEDYNLQLRVSVTLQDTKSLNDLNNIDLSRSKTLGNDTDQKKEGWVKHGDHYHPPGTQIECSPSHTAQAALQSAK